MSWGAESSPVRLLSCSFALSVFSFFLYSIVRAESSVILDPKTALIVIDLQKGVLGRPTIQPIDELLQRVVGLSDAFRSCGLPVVLVNSTGRVTGRTQQGPGSSGPAHASDWTEFLPQLHQQLSDHVVSKHGWGAFGSTDLEQYLRQAGVTQVVVVGIATSIGVESTARQAYDLGFNVSLVVDAMTDSSAEAQESSITWVFPRLGQLVRTQQIIDLLTPHGER